VRVGIQTWGSDGDIRPLLALAAGLERAGHRTRVVASSVDDTDYRPLAQRLGVALDMVPERMDAPLAAIAAAAGRNPVRMLRALFAAALLPHLDALYAAARRLCAESDLVVGHFTAWYLKAAALRAGVPYVSVILWPALVPTRDAPPPRLPDLRCLNRIEWRLFRTVVDLLFRRPAADFFARQGLPPIRHAYPDALGSAILTLVPVSPALWAQPSDWGPRVRACGSFELPSDADAWTPAPDLQQFLETQPAPVFLSLGSSEQIDPEHAHALLRGAIEHAGVRSVLQVKSDRAAGGHHDATTYVLPRAPHAAVFPHCRLIVHHGGAGTTHTVARSGVPSLVVPFVDEQRWWGERLAAAGAAGPSLSYWRATPARLGQRIRVALDADDLQRGAQTLAARLRHDDGVAEAVRLLVAAHAGTLR